MIVELCYTVISFGAIYIWPDFFHFTGVPDSINLPVSLMLQLFKIIAVIPLSLLAKRHPSIQAGKTQFFLLIFPFLLFLYLRYLNYSLWSEYEDVARETAILAVISSLTCYFMLLLNNFQIVALKAQGEIENITLLLQKEKAYYAERARNSEETRRLAHDMKNHLRTLQSLSHEEPVQEYLSSIIGDVAKWDMLYQTGNDSLDIILNEKFHICQEKQICLTPPLSGRQRTFFHPSCRSVRNFRQSAGQRH